jgi:hypothetical protein
MKNIEKVIRDRSNKIELNNLKIIDYKNDNEVLCICNKCNYNINDNYRNLSYKNFKCKYCELLSISDLLKNNEVKILKIEDSYINLECVNGHLYKQDRRNLLAGKKCKQCYLENKIFTKERIIEEISNIHGNYYKYFFKDFKNLHSKIEIECKKGHFFTQKISNHLQGKGCPICRESIGERKIAIFLEKNKISYIRQKKFDDCKYITKLPFDFFIKEMNLLIEFDGIQHFKPVKLFGGEKEFEKTKIKDEIKSRYCLDNNINLIRISYLEDIEEKLSNIKKLITL